jgi:hypothetical protein
VSVKRAAQSASFVTAEADRPADDRTHGSMAPQVDKDGLAEDARIAALAEELASAINEAEAGGRPAMRDFAIDLLKESVQTDVVSTGDGERPAQDQNQLNPAALGIPAFLIGSVLVFLFPPVGIAFFILGGIACVIGVGLAMVRSLRGRAGREDG